MEGSLFYQILTLLICSFQEALQYLKGGLINVKDLNPIVLPLEHALEAFTSGRVNQGGNVITLIECYNEHANKK